MAETIFKDRRKDEDRRGGSAPYGVRDCRRRSNDRRQTQDSEQEPHWWLAVNYAVETPGAH